MNPRKKIKIELIRHNTSGAEIARNLGVCRVFVYNVIHGKAKTQYVRDAIAKAINIPVSDLWPDTNYKGAN